MKPRDKLGPALEAVKPLIERLQCWRDADREDTLILTRGEIIQLLEEIYRLRAQVRELMERPLRIPIRSGEDTTAMLERHIRKAMREPDPEQKP
jgi:hypothetical protein